MFRKFLDWILFDKETRNLSKINKLYENFNEVMASKSLDNKHKLKCLRLLELEISSINTKEHKAKINLLITLIECLKSKLVLSEK